MGEVTTLLKAIQIGLLFLLYLYKQLHLMKSILKFITAAGVLLSIGFAQEKTQNGLAIEGEYKGKNILIKNPYGKGGVGFCVSEVRVNGKTTSDEINATLFQIKLDKLGLKIGDKVRAEIIFNEGCMPQASPMIMTLGAIKKGSDKEMKMVMVGKFMWANVFLTNPKTDNTNYSISEIKVNNKIVPVNLKSDLVEINLTALGLQKTEPIKDGQELIIEVIYQNGFDPIIINPEAIN